MERVLYANWKNQLNILWCGQAILMMVLAMSLPYWPLYLKQLGHFSPQQIRYWSAAVYIAPSISCIFSSPFWGRLGDKYGYKPMVIRASLGLFITQTFILLTSNVVLIVLIRLLQGLLAGFIATAQAWALNISPATERSATIGKLQSATAIGTLMGPLLGGLLATYAGYHAIFTISSLMCAAVTILFIFSLQNVSQVKEMPATTSRVIAKKTWYSLQKIILITLLTIIIIQSARNMITPIFSLFVTEKFGGNDIIIGLLYGATGLMVFISAPFWGKFFDRLVREGYQIYSAIAAILFAAAFIQILHAYATNTTSLFILRLMWGICLGATLPVLLRLLIENADENEKGVFLGWGSSATKVGEVLGIVSGAYIQTQLGYKNSFYVIAFLYFIAGVFTLVQKRAPQFRMDEQVS